LGLDITIYFYHGADANIFGHVGIGVNSQPPLGLEDQCGCREQESKAELGQTVPGALKRSTDRLMATVTIKTAPSVDAAVSEAILEDELDPPDYNALTHNCVQEVNRILGKGGLTASSYEVLPGSELIDLSLIYGVLPVYY